MSISSVASTGTTAPVTPTGQKKNALTQDDFMNLFVAQMRFQDPLQPLDNNQMATQLAQFNTVNALDTMNKTLTQMMSNQAALGNLQADAIHGVGVLEILAQIVRLDQNLCHLLSLSFFR